MRVAAVIALSTLPLAAASARAERWRAEAEAGLEWDSNVYRVEVDPDAPGGTMAVAAPVGRAGARVEGAGDRDGWGRYAINAGLQARVVGADERGEDVAATSLDARWDRALGARRARAGVRVSVADAAALLAEGARTYTLAAADALLVLRGDGDGRFAVTAGARDFTYKPDADFDWRGAAVGARYVTTVWRRAGEPADLAALADLGDLADLGLAGDDTEATIDLALAWRLEQRGYRGVAFTNGCAPGEPVAPACFVPTSERRADLHHVAAVEATYTGDVVASGSYQLTVNDSSSYGQSLVRHRLAASATLELPGALYATGGVTLQLDQYLDPLLLARDVVSQTFTSIDDENRSAIALRVSRRLGRGLAAEARWAFTADSLSGDDLAFRRHVVHAGLTWASDE